MNTVIFPTKCIDRLNYQIVTFGLDGILLIRLVEEHKVGKW